MRGGTTPWLALAGSVLLGLTLWWLTRPVPPRALAFNKISFAELGGWAQDDHAAALAAFQNSCTAWAKRTPRRRLGHRGLGVSVGDFRDACAAAGKMPARKFFESNFVPFSVMDDGAKSGLFTGYYEPLLKGARAKSDAYPVPLYRKPRDLISADLGAFSGKLKGKRIHGRVALNKFLPYHSHAEINAGALQGRGLELIWVDSAVDAFFLQIQGSGRVRLEDGSEVRIGYAGKNGRPYRAIGRDLIANGAITTRARPAPCWKKTPPSCSSANCRATRWWALWARR
jgi:membrane-bound lytic murein transglycosylase A